MNKHDRKEIDRGIALIEEGAQILTDVGDAEIEKFDNLNEGLQQSEMGERLETKGNELIELADEIQCVVSMYTYED